MTTTSEPNRKGLLELLQEDQMNIALYNKSEINKESFLEKSREITQKFTKYIAENGFPFKNSESYELYKAAFVLSLHAGPDFLAKGEEIFRKADPEQIDPEHLAFFVDKRRLYEGKPQVYGTQFKRLADRSIEFLPIENESEVNVRRKEIGLNSLDEYKMIAEQG